MKKKLLKNKPLKGFIAIIVGCMFVFNSCEKDITPNQTNEDIQTVSVNEALRFLQAHQSQRKVKSGKEPYVIPDTENIHYEAITNSNKKITVIPAITINQGDYSRVLMLKINGELKTSVFSMYPDENSTDSLFSGKIFITDLDGQFMNGFRICEGLPVSRFVLKKNQRKMKSCEENTSGEVDVKEKKVEVGEVLVTAPRIHTHHSIAIYYIYIARDFKNTIDKDNKNWNYRGGGSYSSNSDKNKTQQKNNKNKKDLPKKKPKEVKEDCDDLLDAIKDAMQGNFDKIKKYEGKKFSNGKTMPSYQDYLNTIKNSQNEYAWQLIYDAENDTYYSNMRTDNRTNGVYQNHNTNLYACFHNHPNNLPPSPADIKAMFELALNAKDFKAFYTLMNNGTLYAFKVTDKAKMEKFWNAYKDKMEIDGTTNRFKDDTDFYNDWDTAEDKFSKLGKYQAWEYTIAYLFKKYDMGVSLIKKEAKENKFKVQYVRKGLKGRYQVYKCK